MSGSLARGWCSSDDELSGYSTFNNQVDIMAATRYVMVTKIHSERTLLT
jgi:hypothetical protein